MASGLIEEDDRRCKQDQAVNCECGPIVDDTGVRLYDDQGLVHDVRRLTVRNSELCERRKLLCVSISLAQIYKVFPFALSFRPATLQRPEARVRESETVRDRENAFSTIAPSPPSRRQHHRAVSSVAPLGPSRRQIPRAVSTVAPSAPSRTQLRRALSHFDHGEVLRALRESNRFPHLQFIIGDGNNMYDLIDFTYVGNVAHSHLCADRALASEGEVSKKAAGETKKSSNSVLFHSDISSCSGCGIETSMQMWSVQV
ncbi:hypothetical protein AHAS_Ahas20G0114700 [Arachis hypogaea]